MTSMLRALSACAAFAALAAAGLPASATVGTRPNDPLFSQQWSLEQPSDADIDAPEAWTLLSEIGVNKQVVLAVVDSGFDLAHEDLREILWTNPGEIPANGIDDDGNGYIDDVHGYDFVHRNGNPAGGPPGVHGNSTAGVAAAQSNNGLGIAGVAGPAGAKVMLLQTNISTGAEAWDYARAMGVDVVNNSWGHFMKGVGVINAIPLDPRMREASARLDAAGVVQVFASGSGPPMWPDAWDDYNFPGVLRVTRSDRDDRLFAHNESNPNPLFLEIVAPAGVLSIGTTGPEDGPYRMFGGSSAAAPHVSGVALLLRAAFPQLTNAQVVDAIMTGVDVPSADYALYSRSGGRLNAHKALLEAQRIVAGG